jgi:rhodanese-related sulfurtransferase
MLILLAGCASSDATAEYAKITAEEAKQMMDDGDGFILLDVRTEEEFAESHIEGAILIPDTEIAERASDELPDPDAQILVYCRSGRRSAQAADALTQLGYTSVYDFGGIIDWPYETISG